ncbi:MAG: hypothetical protein IT181_25350 [Acidobacteria bacterium]|nr:hypothetical protein [Acidobacteriota bacterium]
MLAMVGLAVTSTFNNNQFTDGCAQFRQSEPTTTAPPSRTSQVGTSWLRASDTKLIVAANFNATYDRLRLPTSLDMLISSV